MLRNLLGRPWNIDERIFEQTPEGVLPTGANTTAAHTGVMPGAKIIGRIPVPVTVPMVHASQTTNALGNPIVQPQPLIVMASTMGPGDGGAPLGPETGKSGNGSSKAGMAIPVGAVILVGVAVFAFRRFIFRG